MSDWNKLEEDVKELLKFDQPVRTPLSGGTKGEEDVVGINSVSQCKCTDDKNLSILSKDLDRLISNANLINKLPIFFNRSSAGTTVSLPITDETNNIVLLSLELACLIYGLGQLQSSIKYIHNVQQLGAARKEIARLLRMFGHIRHPIEETLNKINCKLTYAEEDLLTFDLFEGDNNGTQCGEEKTSSKDDDKVPQGS